MKVVIEQSKLQESRVTYQAVAPATVKCRKCKGDSILLVEVHDDGGEIKEQRPENVRIWPHDALVIHIYLCTNCGSMRATWNQG